MIALIILILIGIVLYIAYAGVIRAKNQLDDALSGIDVQLKKRSDLIPNVLTIAKKFMKHEEEIFTEITKLRTEVNKNPIGSSKRFEAESALQQQMKQLAISVENYPQLKSNDTMVKAMEAYMETEENIAAARRFYNAALRELKNRVMIFPGSLFESFAGDCIKMVYFEATESERKEVKAEEYL